MAFQPPRGVHITARLDGGGAEGRLHLTVREQSELSPWQRLRLRWARWRGDWRSVVDVPVSNGDEADFDALAARDPATFYEVVAGHVLEAYDRHAG